MATTLPDSYDLNNQPGLRGTYIKLLRALQTCVDPVERNELLAQKLTISQRLWQTCPRPANDPDGQARRAARAELKHFIAYAGKSLVGEFIASAAAKLAD